VLCKRCVLEMFLLWLLLGLIGILVDALTVSLVDKLLIDNVAIKDYYGSDLSIDGDYGVIGSLGNNNYAGYDLNECPLDVPQDPLIFSPIVGGAPGHSKRN
jgi:hypothetical protein